MRGMVKRKFLCSVKSHTGFIVEGTFRVDLVLH